MVSRSTGKREDAPSQPTPFRDSNSDVEQTLVSVDFRQIIGILRRRAWLVLLVAAVTLAGVWYYLHVQLPRYQANAVIRLVDRRRALTGGLIDPKSTEQTTERSMSPLLSQIQVLLSRQVASIVVDSTDAFGLRLQGDNLPSGMLTNVHLDSASHLDSVQLRFLSGMVFAQGYATIRDTSLTEADSGLTARAAVGKPLTLGGLSLVVTKAAAQPTAILRVVSRSDATDALLKNLSAKPRSETDVIDVLYESTDNHAAQRIVNSMVHIFASLNAETANQQARARRAFVEDQLRQNDSLVAEVEGAVSAAAAARTRSTPGRDLTSGELVALTTLQSRQQEMRADAIFYRNLLSQLSGARTGNKMDVLRALVASPGLASNTVVTQLYTQLDGMRNTRDSLVSGPFATATTNPDVRRLDARIISAEASLVDALQNYLASIEGRLAALDTITSSMKPRVITDPEAREAGLTSQLASLRKSGDALREERQQARIAAAAELGEVEIVDEAPLPTTAIGSSRLLKLALGLGAGLALGCIFAFIVEALDGLNTSIRRNSEIESLLNLPALGLIPPDERSQGTGKWRMLRFRRGDRQRTPEEELVSVSKMQSPNAEAYRALRTNLLFSQAVRNLRTLVVTSATSAEGKTTTAANLAVTFARQGVRVLLVDCDLRRPRVHAIMSVAREPGLTQVLLEQLSLEEAVRPGVIPNLFVLSAGRLPPNPTELLGGSRMKVLLEKLMQSYDLVVLDSPPVLLTPDAAVLGAICDGVLLVLRAGKTQQQAAREVLRQLAAVNAYLVGAVLNDPDSKVPNSDRQFAYGYGADYYAASSAGGVA